MPLNDLVLYKYSTDLIFLTFNISCVGFYYQGLPVWFFGYVTRVLCKPHPSCLRYHMRGREFYLSRLAHLVSDFSAILLGSYSTLRISSFLPSISHAGESFTYQDLHIGFFGYLDLGVCCSPHPFCPQHLTLKTSLTNSVFFHKV